VRLTSHEESVSSFIDRLDRGMEEVDRAQAAVERLEEIESEFEALRADVGDEALRERVADLEATVREEFAEEIDRLDEELAQLTEWQRNLRSLSNGGDGDRVEEPPEEDWVQGFNEALAEQDLEDLED